MGAVVSVGILSTKVLDRDERLVVIPNNTLVESKVINHARGGGDGVARRISIVLDIGVDYREDIDHVKYTLLQLAKSVLTLSINQNHESSCMNWLTLQKYSVSTHGLKITVTNTLHATGSCATLTNGLARKTSTFHSQLPSYCRTVSTNRQRLASNALQSARWFKSVRNLMNLGSALVQKLKRLLSNSRMPISPRKIDLN